VKRDATPPPLVTCASNPAVLWPPNGKPVPVTTTVTVADATAGPGGFLLAMFVSVSRAAIRHRRI
jgi:hypothetical protein